jgi:MoaA/NifB/PqqE/SkfB family radical SAM enzyme
VGVTDTSSLRGYPTRAKGELTQATKKALLRLGIVPPPLQVQIDIPDRCSLQCPTWSESVISASAEELPPEQWREVLRNIRAVPLLGEVSISRGQPFARPDTLRILEATKALGLRAVLLPNGWAVDGKGLRRLEEIGVDRLMVSLNRIQESVHMIAVPDPSCERILRLLI